MARQSDPEPPAVGGAKPSQVTDVYWLSAKRKVGEYPAHTERGGKWLLFVPVAQVDEVWTKIKESTEGGLLGSSAKVATAMPNPNAKNSGTKVICVYTYDSTDAEDVRRVRAKLRELGFVRKISYKADNDTKAGKYAVRGDKRISKYYE